MSSFPVMFAGLSWRRIISFRGATWLVLCGFLVAYLLASRDFGMGWDEGRRWDAGDAKLAYYGEVLGYLRGEADAFPRVGTDRYPGLFDMSLALLDRLLPWDRLMLGHAFSAFWGWSALVGVAILGRWIGGWTLSFLSVSFLGLVPVFLGHAGHNPKDIPFAASYLWGVVGLVWLVRTLPHPRLHVWLSFGCLVGLSAATRVAGGVHFAYLAAILILWMLLNPETENLRSASRRIADWAPRAALAGSVAFGILFLFWPAIHAAPFGNTWTSMSQLHDLHSVASVKYVHFRGQFYEAGAAPWYYVPWMVAIKLPELWILGLGASVAFAAASALRMRGRWRELLLKHLGLVTIFLSVAVPLTYALVVQPQVHNGIRHVLFLVPPLALLSAYGILRSLKWVHRQHPRFALPGMVFVVAALGLSAERSWSLHPYQYVYFNALVGGSPGAYGHYELDYWCLANREAFARRDEWAPRREGVHYRVHVSGLAEVARYFLPDDMEIVPIGAPADFFLGTTSMLAHELVPGEPVFVIHRAGLPILVVKKVNRTAE